MPRRDLPRAAIPCVEELECRRTPAVLLNPLTLAYTDADGDAVTVRVAHGDLSRAAFTFAAGARGQQLVSIDLRGDSGFMGADLTIQTQPRRGGDGHAHVGFLNAAGLDLGTVAVDG